MLFNSFVFLFVFLPITYVVFWLLRGAPARYVWLTLTGYVFYGYWNPWFCILMAFSTLTSYAAGLGFLRWRAPRVRKVCLIVPIAVDLSLLGFFKYANFAAASVGSLFHALGTSAHVPHWNIILPIGISFYMFHTISYIVDSYRGVIGMGLAFVLSAEITARVDDYVHIGVPLSAVPDLANDLILRDSLGVRGRPNGRFQRLNLNSAGFRSAESVLTPVPGCIRVMTLGSSETFGVATGSPNKEYPAQLDALLSKHGCYQVMNGAIVGATTPRTIQLWNTWASRFHPDIVVILANPIFYLANEPPTFHALSPGQPTSSRWWTLRLIGKARQVFRSPDFIERRRVQWQLRQLTSGRAPGVVLQIDTNRPARAV